MATDGIFESRRPLLVGVRNRHDVLRPEFGAGYRRLIGGFVVLASVPWLVMGAGILFGGVRGVSMYFNPRNGPFVIAWYVCAVVLLIVSAVWLFLMRGSVQ